MHMGESHIWFKLYDHMINSLIVLSQIKQRGDTGKHVLHENKYSYMLVE